MKGVRLPNTLNDYYRVAQLGLLKMKPFTNFGSSTSSMEKMWRVEFSFMIGSYYVPLHPLANEICVLNNFVLIKDFIDII